MQILDPISYLNQNGFSVDHKTIKENSSKTVVVGMSGGVDSSVVAVLTKLLGFNTIGIFMKNWEEKDENGQCSSEIDFKDVVSVCNQIDIPYYSVNFAKEYEENVFRHFLQEYEKGYTPNPDILCNREIKFKVFLDKVKEFGADYLATGHYCQVRKVGDDFQLLKGADQKKDQSYFLYAIDGTILNRVLFPLGHLEKSVVRKIAKDFNLKTSEKKDSTGICFIGERNFKEFLSTYIEKQKGDFVDLESGKVIKEHDGMCFYTPGQRKGLGIGGPGGPWFVAKKDPNTNEVFVVEGEKHPALYADELWANEETWINSEPSFPLECFAKIRYRQGDQRCIVHRDGDELKVVFTQPQRAITVRQSIVFYDDDICLGGAMIAKAGKTHFDKATKD